MGRLVVVGYQQPGVAALQPIPAFLLAVALPHFELISADSTRQCEEAPATPDLDGLKPGCVHPFPANTEDAPQPRELMQVDVLQHRKTPADDMGCPMVAGSMHMEDRGEVTAPHDLDGV